MAEGGWGLHKSGRSEAGGAGWTVHVVHALMVGWRAMPTHRGLQRRVRVRGHFSDYCIFFGTLPTFSKHG